MRFPSTSAAELVGTPATKAIQSFAAWEASAAAACANAAALGCSHVSVLAYPSSVSGGAVRTAHTTSLQALQAHYLSDLARVSEYARGKVADIVSKFKEKKAGGAAGAKRWKSGVLDKLAFSQAKTTALHTLLRVIFGIRRSPQLTPIQEGLVDDNAPLFLSDGVLRQFWCKPWGSSCLQACALKPADMVKVLQHVLLDFENGSCLSESVPARASPSLVLYASPLNFSCLSPPFVLLLQCSAPKQPRSGNRGWGTRGCPTAVHPTTRRTRVCTWPGRAKWSSLRG